MPEIARFDGIVISMYLNDHAPPHFHVTYAGFSWSVEIVGLSVQGGRMPSAIHRRVTRWAEGRQEFLLARWADLGGAPHR